MSEKIRSWIVKLIFHRLMCAFLVVCFVFTTPYATPIRNSPKALYKIAKKKYYSLNSSSRKKQFESNWLDVIRLFKDIFKKYPNSYEAYKATFTIGRLFERLYIRSHNPKHLKLAMVYFDKVVSKGGGDHLVDDALYAQGKILLKQKKSSKALELFAKIINKYPNGDQALNAKEKINELKQVLRDENKNAPKNQTSSHTYVTLNGVKLSPKSVPNQVLIQLDGPAIFEINKLSKPNRYYIDIKNSYLKKGLPKEIRLDRGLLREIRISQFSKTISRIVLELSGDRTPQVRAKNSPSGIILDLPKPKKMGVIEKTINKPQFDKVVDSNGDDKDSTIPLIVLDPGHGGKDDGARGEKGLLEKDLNLAISKRIKRILKNKYKYRVLMTRTNDTYISLEKRGEIANNSEADIFISVHINAAQRKGAKGIETYFLGSGLTERARETAARENGKVIFSVPDNDVQRILMDMEANRKMNNSACLARKVQDKLSQGMSKFYRGIKNLGVKEGPFFVLHKTYMPSILVEVGFITNSQEEARLSRSIYLDQLASNIAKGVQSVIPIKKKCVSTI